MSESTIFRTIMDCYIKIEHWGKKTAVKNVQYRDALNFVSPKVYMAPKVTVAGRNNTHGLSKNMIWELFGSVAWVISLSVQIR